MSRLATGWDKRDGAGFAGNQPHDDRRSVAPRVETDHHLLFSQLGLHSNQDRNIANFGVGYRHYRHDWMFGVNTFYDYDYTGKNARLGAGGGGRDRL
ncbi:hypothetical protein CWS02_24335 [Enterobacter sp. EA-1]|nr:hypothetical protein CWS02_24335 [Enterobacter sp. EA-1]